MTICDATIAKISDMWLALTPASWEEWMAKRLEDNQTYRLVWSAYLAGTIPECWFRDHANAA